MSLRWLADGLVNRVVRACHRQYIPVRYTWVFKRQYDLPRSPTEGPPRELREPIDYTYEVIHNTDDLPTPPIECIITEDVENIGLKGDIVSVDRWLFRHQLYPCGQATYASEEMLSLYADEVALRRRARDGDGAEGVQSVAAFTTVSHLQRLTLRVPMSAEHQWTVGPEHVLAAFRRAGVVVPAECLATGDLVEPPVTRGEIRDFTVHVTVNNTDTVPVKCHVMLYSKEEGILDPNPTEPP